MWNSSWFKHFHIPAWQPLDALVHRGKAWLASISADALLTCSRSGASELGMTSVACRRGIVGGAPCTTCCAELEYVGVTIS